MRKMYTGIRLVFNTGGTRTKLAISMNGSSLVQTVVIPTNPDPEKWVEELVKKAREMAGENKIGAVAGGIAGVFDHEKSKLLRSPNLTEWENKPIKLKLQKMFDAPVWLDNDTVMEGLGEATLGAGRRFRIVAFVAVGTGIGGVKLEDGRVCPNTYGFEPGHQIIDVDGDVGYWEEFASGSALIRTYGKEPEEIKEVEIWETETRILAIGLHNIILLWSPEILILGGSVMKSIDLPALKKEIGRQMHMFPTLPKIVKGELLEKAGLYGALEYLRGLDQGI